MPFDVRSILTSPNSTQKVYPIESQEPLSISGIALHLLQFLVIGLVFWLRDVANTVYTAGLKLLSIFLQYLYSCGIYLDPDFAARWGPEANLQAWFWCGDELRLNGISRKNALIPKTAPMSSPAFENSSPDREFDSNCDKHGALFTSSMSHTSFFGRLQENTISSPVKNAFVDARPLPSLLHDAYEPRASATVKTRAVVKRRTFPRAPAGSAEIVPEMETYRRPQRKDLFHVSKDGYDSRVHRGSQIRALYNLQRLTGMRGFFSTLP